VADSVAASAGARRALARGAAAPPSRPTSARLARGDRIDPTILERRRESRRLSGLRELRLDREPPGQERRIAASLIGAARRRRRGAEVERVAAEIGVVGKPRERLPRGHVHRGRAAEVFRELERAIAHHLAGAVGPGEAHRIGTVLKIERGRGLGRGLDQRAADHEPTLGGDAVGRSAGPPQRPAPGSRAVTDLKPRAGERKRDRMGIEQLDVLATGVVTRCVVEDFDDARMERRRARRHRRSGGEQREGGSREEHGLSCGGVSAGLR
jgi:hypothetical protein